MIKNAHKDIKRLENLANNGKLIKNLNYQKVLTTDGEYSSYAISIEYEVSKGYFKTFLSKAHYNKNQSENDGLADLLIDPMDPDNYYIGFNIQENNSYKDISEYSDKL